MLSHLDQEGGDDVLAVKYSSWQNHPWVKLFFLTIGLPLAIITFPHWRATGKVLKSWDAMLWIYAQNIIVDLQFASNSHDSIFFSIDFFSLCRCNNIFFSIDFFRLCGCKSTCCDGMSSRIDVCCVFKVIFRYPKSLIEASQMKMVKFAFHTFSNSWKRWAMKDLLAVNMFPEVSTMEPLFQYQPENPALSLNWGGPWSRATLVWTCEEKGLW